jgi:hypothetical protein
MKEEFCGREHSYSMWLTTVPQCECDFSLAGYSLACSFNVMLPTFDSCNKRIG